MSERPFARRSLSFVRGAARTATVLATLGLASAGTSLGGTSATPFQLAYVSATSGPASGGTPVNLVGNQFSPSATVTIGGTGVAGVVTNSTLIKATSPGLTAGALYDIVVDNGGPAAVLPKGWFSDFADVSQASPYHAPVETIIRDGITAGCGGGNYCPASSVTRAQMAVFLLRAEHGAAYVPPPATGTVFGDVHQGDFAADWIEQLYAEGITGGCQGGTPPNYCPASSVTRGQMSVFLLKIYHGNGYAPPAATGVFSDVPTSSPFAPWVEELARLYVTTGCGGSLYCPNNAVTRGQMAVFLAKTFHRPEATRFLEQATWGPKDSDIAGVLGQGYLPWLASQYSIPPSLIPAQPLVPDSTPSACGDGTAATPPNCRRDNYSTFPLYTAFFKNALYGQDQLRQRVFFALHKIDVVSTNTITRPSQVIPYLNLLNNDAFGNYRDLLEDLTLNPAMGEFLNMDTSTKNSPNENYAREVMQLFSIGTDLLNQDGSTQNDGVTGLPLPSYDQSVIDNMKLVFTGWYIPSVSVSLAGDTDTTGDYLNPMPIHKNGSNQEDRHDTSAKNLFLGFLPNLNGDGAATAIPSGQPAATDLSMGLDALFNHPNIAPYLARELIHNLVTSNPSPAYIERVAGFFNDNGSGVRGSLWAVVKAILLDPEARNAPADVNYGKLKEPAEFMLGILRAFNAQSANRSTQSDGAISTCSNCARDQGQEIWKPPTVFSYFPQDYYAPPASAGLFGPEFGVMDASTSLKRANFMNTIVFSSIAINCSTTSCYTPNGTSIDLTELQQLAPNSANLVDKLNRLLLHGAMSDDMRTSIVGAVEAVTPSTDTLKRARQALYLVATSSQYQVQR
ncbi:MAG TPA: DUF1800 family protein [Thermoanaerobaculia bacterium]|nr:DUF1800 family protein [Thermoanaerobaculia bacterium]